MNEQQKTFGSIVGMDSIVPVGPHHDDVIVCSNGAECSRSEAFYDCRNNPHFTEKDRLDADVEIVTDILTMQDEWVCDYCTNVADYADRYDCIVGEGHHNWPGRIEEWLCDNYGDIHGRTDFDDRMQDVVEFIYDRLKDYIYFEPIYDASDYATYYGEGLCLDSFEVGEYENQIDIDYIPELKKLHDSNELDDVLDCVNCDIYIDRSKRRVKNEKTGYYEYIGRETYDPYNSDYPNLMSYHNPGGQWHFIVPMDYMKDTVKDALNHIGK